MTTAIILAAGHGRRMGGSTPKQVLESGGVPVIVRSLSVFDQSPEIDEILLVTSHEYVNYCCDRIVSGYGLRKVRAVILGGRERYDSVYNALLACSNSDYVMIHDGARPFITEDVIRRVDAAVRRYGAAAAGVPSKDTIKLIDEDGFAAATPPRDRVWQIQTPQAFTYDLIRRANDLLRTRGDLDGVTDDAMIVEKSGLARVRLVEGSYGNIKITTPEDLRRFEVRS